MRWPGGLQYVRCEGDRISRIQAVGRTGKERHLYYCADCDYQYSVTVGTIFHKSHLPLTKWFLAIYMICSAKKGISVRQLQRELHISYKTAWHMAHRIRLAMQEDKDFCQNFSGIVEVDETYIGGKRSGPRGRGASSNVPVVGIRERTSGKIRMQAVEDVTSTTLAQFSGTPSGRVDQDEIPLPKVTFSRAPRGVEVRKTA